MRRTTLLTRHAAQDALHALEVLFTLGEICVLEHLRTTRQQADDVLKRPKLLHLAELHEEVIQGELTLAHLLLKIHRLGGIDTIHRLLDERDDIAHAQDALGHALGMK